MQTLATFLRSLANIQLILQQLQNRQVAYAVSNQIKAASNLCSRDFVDVADTVDEGIHYADSLCDEDVTRLRSVASLLRECNQHLHRVQDRLIIKDQSVTNLSLPKSGE